MMDFRQRLEQNRTKPAGSELSAEPEETTSSTYFATDRGTHPACLELRLADGVRKAVPYLYFTEMNFDLDMGIELLTATKRIKVIGRDLATLFDHLILYRVRYVQMNIGSDSDEIGVFVKAIVIEEL